MRHGADSVSAVRVLQGWSASAGVSAGASSLVSVVSVESTVSECEFYAL